jgi:hypothetical protein
MTEQELMDLVNDLRLQVGVLKQRVEDLAKQNELRQDDQKANSND